MSPSTTTDPGHAVRPDGTLKDASEIVWTYDADDDIPFPSGSTSGEPLSSGGQAPAMVLGATRRTTRVPRPSKRALEAAETSSSATKRKASTNRDQRVTRKIIDLDDDDANKADDDYIPTTDIDVDITDFDGPSDLATEPADDYAALEAMADADNRVCMIFSSKFTCSLASQALNYKSRHQRTADIRLIFRYDESYVHPLTGMHLKGHWCELCL
jgi:hypothetical protein